MLLLTTESSPCESLRIFQYDDTGKNRSRRYRKNVSLLIKLEPKIASVLLIKHFCGGLDYHMLLHLFMLVNLRFFIA